MFNHKIDCDQDTGYETNSLADSTASQNIIFFEHEEMLLNKEVGRSVHKIL